MNLYEMSEEMQSIEGLMNEYAAEHEGDITDFPLTDRLEELEGEKTLKFLNIGCFIKNLTAKAGMIDKEEKALKARKAALKGKAARLKDYMQNYMEKGEKLSDGRVAISWRKSQKVKLDCEVEDLPIKYRRIKEEADKTGMKTDLKAGVEIPNVELTNELNVQVK